MGSRRNLTQFRERVSGITNRHPDWGAKDIAEKLNCDVRRVRRALGWLQKHKSASVPEFNPANPMVRADVLAAVTRRRKKGVTAEQIARKLCTTPDNIVNVMHHLIHHGGYNIILGTDGCYRLSDVVEPKGNLTIEKLKGKEIKFGLVSDTHLCSKHARLDVLEAAYDMFAKEGITEVFHAGNMLDGEFRFNRYELVAHGVHDQVAYMADNYPQRRGITTHFITGECHEGWWQKDTGLRIGWYMEHWARQRGREDLIHMDHVEQDVIYKAPMGTLRMRIIHPGGGTPYAVSYPSQKMVESFQGGEKPQILVMGHYHKFDMCYPREVLTVMPGCVQDQTTFMRKQKIRAEVGFCIGTIGVRVDGTLGRFGIEWFPFYDKGYHKKLEGYEIPEKS